MGFWVTIPKDVIPMDAIPKNAFAIPMTKSLSNNENDKILKNMLTLTLTLTLVLTLTLPLSLTLALSRIYLS